MQIVIDLPKEAYEYISTTSKLGWLSDKEFVEIIKNGTPTPQPKIGRWIADGTCDKTVPIEDGCPTKSCYCSECGEWLVASDEYSCFGNYCPNCGATMAESEDREQDEK